MFISLYVLLTTQCGKGSDVFLLRYEENMQQSFVGINLDRSTPLLKN